VGFIGETLAKYRIHGTNISKRINPRTDLERILDFIYAVQKKSSCVEGKLNFPRNQALLGLQLSFLLFCKGDEVEAIRCLNWAFSEDPTLSIDVDFLNEWLNQWKPDFYTFSHKNFNFWFISQIQPSIKSESGSELVEKQFLALENQSFFIQRGIQLGLKMQVPGDISEIFKDWPTNIQLQNSWRKKILSEAYSALLFESQKRRDLEKVRFFLRKAIQSRPAWLLNRGIWSIGLQSLRGNI